MNEREEVRVNVDCGTLTVGYWPEALTDSLRAECLQLLDRGEWGRLYVRLLSRVVIDWDLVGEDGKPYPRTEEALMTLPIFLLSAVTQAIINHKPRPYSAMWPDLQVPS